MHGVAVPVSDSQSHLHSHHSLDSVAEMVATAASATVSNVVGMIGTEAGLSVQTAAMKVQCIDQLSTRQMRRSSRRRTYVSLHPHGPKTNRGFNQARACTGPTRPYHCTLPETEPARAGLRTVRPMLNAGWPALLAALSFLLYHEPLRLHLWRRSGRSLAPQGASHCPPYVMRSSLPSRKPHSHHASSPRSMNRNRLRLRCAPPSHLRDSRSVWREVAEVATHHRSTATGT
ncbi:hypothetical protein F5888DRAFT_516838 [Russula emetica]|nr:hypothetical protein F5888DRAFT_516838 [Russula emetica]